MLCNWLSTFIALIQWLSVGIAYHQVSNFELGSPQLRLCIPSNLYVRRLNSPQLWWGELCASSANYILRMLRTVFSVFHLITLLKFLLLCARLNSNDLAQV